LRVARLIRTAVLLLSGIVIAFTGMLHEQLGFDRWLLFLSFLLVGIALGVEFLALRDERHRAVFGLRAAATLAAAFVLIFMPTSFAFAAVIAVWAVLTALLTAVRITQGAVPRGTGGPSALLSLMLAVFVLLFARDPLAVIGFYGGEVMIRGVFLGISVFEKRIAPDESAESTESDAITVTPPESVADLAPYSPLNAKGVK
jgi:hypothetical protein